MRITGINNALPLHMARAYGVKPPSNAPASSIAASIKPQRADSYQPASSINNLVAAKVSQPISFDAPAATAKPQAPAGVFQMYTRAADKMEAAVAVQIGRSLDITA